VFTVNGALRPLIAIAPGERQFWRIVNASPDLSADLKVDSEQLEIVVLDGMPLAFHDPARRTEFVDHILVPLAGRVGAIVSGPIRGAHASLRTLCFDTGPDGDPNRAMGLADITDSAQAAVASTTVSRSGVAPIYKPISTIQVASVEDSPPDFIVTFTEDKGGVYINGKKFGMADPPMTTVATGSYRHWRVVNNTQEVHPFHIHQVHFLNYCRNDRRLAQPEWLDTVDVPVNGSVDLLMDFTDPHHSRSLTVPLPLVEP